MTKTIFSCLTLLLTASTAMAEDDAVGTPEATEPTTPESLSPSEVNTDPAPPVESPEASLPPASVADQAGVGGPATYGREGVVEVGGSVGIQMSTELRALRISPSIGWFIADNLEVSGLLSVANSKAGDESATMWSVFVEPSYHIPFSRRMFGVLGMGIGAGYEEHLGAGLAVAPRIGAQFLIGSFGVLSPSLQYEYVTHNDMSDGNVAVVALTSALSANIGYTAMW